MAEAPRSSERFTDEEWRFLRYVRFGTLPDRVRPDEMVELVETDLPYHFKGQAFDSLVWVGGGGDGFDGGDGD